jgi:hypothetical protein
VFVTKDIVVLVVNTVSVASAVCSVAIFIVLVIVYSDLGLCPKGNDPLTPTNQYRSITLKIGGPATGFFLLSYNGDSISIPATGSLFSATACEEAFESLQGIGTVTCTRGTVNSYLLDYAWVTEYTVVFYKFPLAGFASENNLFYGDGSLPLSALACDVRTAAGDNDYVHCSLADYKSSQFFANKTMPGIRKLNIFIGIFILDS